jgi:hypothetical protein
MTEAQQWIDKWMRLPRWGWTEPAELMNFLQNARRETKQLCEESMKNGDRKWTFFFKDGSHLEISYIDQLRTPAMARVLKSH